MSSQVYGGHRHSTGYPVRSGRTSDFGMTRGLPGTDARPADPGFSESMVAPTLPVPVTDPGRITRAAVAVLLAVLWGGGTSFLQLLPGTWNALGNSVGAWTVPVVLLIWATRLGPRAAAVTGALVFVGMSMGYSLVSTLRGYPDLELAWAAIGLVAGPVVGVATAALRERERTPAAIGAGVLTGIVAGDAIRGLTLLPDYTGSWVVLAGLALLLAWLTASVRRLTAGNLATLTGVAVVVAAAYQGAMLLLDLVL